MKGLLTAEELNAINELNNLTAIIKEFYITGMAEADIAEELIKRRTKVVSLLRDEHLLQEAIIKRNKTNRVKK